MSQSSNAYLEALNAALDSLTTLRVAIGLVSERPRSIQRRSSDYDVTCDPDGTLVRIAYHHSGKVIWPSDDQQYLTIELRSDYEWLPKYIDSLWEAYPKADAALAALPRRLHERLDALTGKPWLSTARRNCLDLILKWPGETGHQTSMGAAKVYGRISELLEQAAEHDPFPTWARFAELLDEYKHDLVAIRDAAEQEAPAPEPPLSPPAQQKAGQIWTVEDYYRAKKLYEENGAIFNPALEYGSPAAYHVAAQASLRASDAGVNVQHLKPKEQEALKVITADGPISGKVLAKRIKRAESTVRRHLIPKLRQHGVRNDGAGYYVAMRSAT